MSYTFPNMHGFAIIDPYGNQIAILSAGPNGNSSAIITLSVMGTYKLHCLYLCGSWHDVRDKMQGVTLLKVSS
jgi:heme/copper-type cytochrome/quinol oxidase subunit 2